MKKKIDILYNKYVETKDKKILNRIKYEMMDIAKKTCKVVSHIKTKGYSDPKTMYSFCFERFDKIINDYEPTHKTTLSTYTAICLWNYLRSRQYHKSLDITKSRIYTTQSLDTFNNDKLKLDLKSILGDTFDYKLICDRLGLNGKKLSTKELAKMYNKPVNTIYVTLWRAKNKLRKYFKNN